MNDSLLMIFVKNLIPGMVKTRLAKDIGIDKALDVYMELVRHTHKVTKKLEVDKIVYYSEYVEIEDVWEEDIYGLQVQKGNSFGERMSNAFDRAFDSYNKVIIIGSDCYDISSKIIKEAYAKLDEHDVVVGPAVDGGYYLLGMKEFIPQFFENKTFSTSTVLQELLEEAEDLHLEVYHLPKIGDIDTIEDLKKSGMKWEELGEQGFEEEFQ